MLDEAALMMETVSTLVDVSIGVYCLYGWSNSVQGNDAGDGGRTRAWVSLRSRDLHKLCGVSMIVLSFTAISECIIICSTCH